MRILIVSDAWKPQLNGVVRTYEFLCEALERTGHETRVIGPAEFPWRAALPGYKEIELALFPYARLARMIDAFKPGSIHIGTEGPLGRAALKYCKRHGMKFTTAYHTHFPDYAAKRAAKYLPFLAAPVKKFATAMLRKFHNAGDGIVTATASLESHLRENGFTAPFYRVTRGVDLDLFSLEGPEAMADLPRPVALYVGRVAIEKNLEAFLSMKWEGSKVIIGDGPDLPMLSRKYPGAHFAGRHVGKDLAAHYRGADIFVFPSRTDTFGMVLTEALSCGLPVAGYNVTGPADIITAPYLGSIHDLDLSEAARQALAVKDLKAERHQHVRDHYTWDIAARQFIDAILHAEGKK